jgi:hypothetical protein
MATSREYRQFARQSTKWAAEANTDEVRNAFLSLAADWTLAAIYADRAPKEASPTGKPSQLAPRLRLCRSRGVMAAWQHARATTLMSEI